MIEKLCYHVTHVIVTQVFCTVFSMEYSPSPYLAVLVMTERREPLHAAVFASPSESRMHIYSCNHSLLCMFNSLKLLISLVKTALCVTLVRMSVLFFVLEENISS